LIWEKSGKGKGKKEAPQVLERGFPPITKVTGFQPIYLSMKRMEIHNGKNEVK
jgi:X-Pro dipeptidyl-peptidase